MSILAERKDTASADDLEREAFGEFLKEQATDHALEYIERYGNLRFVLSEGSSAPTFTAPPEAEQAVAGKPAKARPVSELSPKTRDQARKARTRKFTPVINAVLLLAVWALMVSFAVQFMDFPLNYLLGAAFFAPIILISVKLLRNAKHKRE